MKSFFNSLINKLSLLEQKQTTNLGTKEFGERSCFLIFEKTQQYFDNHELMETLGITESNVAVREIHILIMFSIFNCVKDLHVNGDIKNLIMDSILDAYTDFLVQHTKTKGIDEELLFKEADKLVKLIFKRFGQYTEILKKYSIDVLRNDSTDGSCNELERGCDLMQVLDHITSHECDDENAFPSIYFFNFFINLTMDEQIRNAINSDLKLLFSTK